MVIVDDLPVGNLKVSGKFLKHLEVNHQQNLENNPPPQNLRSTETPPVFDVNDNGGQGFDRNDIIQGLLRRPWMVIKCWWPSPLAVRVGYPVFTNRDGEDLKFATSKQLFQASDSWIV